VEGAGGSSLPQESGNPDERTSSTANAVGCRKLERSMVHLLKRSNSLWQEQITIGTKDEEPRELPARPVDSLAIAEKTPDDLAAFGVVARHLPSKANGSLSQSR
jgi:hypothetical protein